MSKKILRLEDIERYREGEDFYFDGRRWTIISSQVDYYLDIVRLGNDLVYRNHDEIEIAISAIVSPRRSRP